MPHRGCACDELGQNKIVRVGKNSGLVLSHLWTKVHEILGQRRRPFVYVPTDTPDLGHAFSNRTHFRACGRFWLSVIQRAQRIADEKERKKIESVVKYKSADMYVGRSNK